MLACCTLWHCLQQAHKPHTGLLPVSLSPSAVGYVHDNVWYAWSLRVPRRERAQLLVDWCGVGAAWMMPLGVLPVTPGLARVLAHNLRNWFMVVVGVGAFMATQRQVGSCSSACSCIGCLSTAPCIASISNFRASTAGKGAGLCLTSPALAAEHGQALLAPPPDVGWVIPAVPCDLRIIMPTPNTSLLQPKPKCLQMSGLWC